MLGDGSDPKRERKTGIADEDADVGVDSGHGANFERLVEIKRKYDPDNLFRLNNNISPS